MTSKCLVLVALATGCVVPEEEGDEQLDVVEEALINCPPGEPYCEPYPTPTIRKPDLVPMYLAGSDGRCNWDGYNLRFAVRNTGNASASASRVWLGFSASYGRYYAVPSLAAGATYNVYAEGLRLDPNCYTNQCSASVIVDSGATVTESNESNNRSSKFCDFHF
jgi:hypothetical protein